MQRVLAIAMISFSLPLQAPAASYDVFDVDGGARLGGFEAPASGGPLTAASFTIGGTTLDQLLGGSTAPSWDPLTGFVTGPGGGGFGGITVSSPVAFTLDDATMLVLAPGELVFSLTDGADTPGEWYFDVLAPGFETNVSLGFYEVAPAAVPLPAAASLLGAGLAALALARRRRSA